MGDYVDLIRHDDKRFNPAEIDPYYKISDLKDLAVKQTDRFYSKIKPIADKVIVMLYGNHEESYIKYNGFDPVKYLNKMIPDAKRLGYVGMIKLDVKRNPDKLSAVYYIDLNHGMGGGGFREGYAINKVHDLFRWTSGDFRVMGHLHALDTDWADFREWGGIQRVWYGVSGCFMYKEKEGTRGYFEANAGKPSGIGMLKAMIKVGRDKRDSRTRLIECLY